MSHISVGQLGKLIEIDNAGEGIGESVQDLIRRLCDGGVLGSKNNTEKETDPRFRAAKFLWDKEFGASLPTPAKSFEEYLAGIPSEIPENPEPKKYPYLVLVDRRPGLKKSCELLEVAYGGNDNTFEDHDKDRRQGDVYWIWANNGFQNRDKKPSVCREGFKKPEIGLTAFEGIMLPTQHEEALGLNRAIDLVGSVHAQYRDDVAYVCRYGDGTLGLDWDGNADADPGYGSGSRRD